MGSFITCWAYRYSRGMSILFITYSFCEHCKKELSFVDLIPIINLLYNRGKCRKCGEPFDKTSTIIEIIYAIYLPLSFYIISNKVLLVVIIVMAYVVAFFALVIKYRLEMIKKNMKEKGE